MLLLGAGISASGSLVCDVVLPGLRGLSRLFDSMIRAWVLSKAAWASALLGIQASIVICHRRVEPLALGG